MNKTQEKRSKIIYIILAVTLSLLAVGGVAVAFMLNYNTFAPEKPVILDDGQNIYISSSMNDNYKGYRFKFVDEEEEEILIDSQNNQISADELLSQEIELGETYKISVCFLAENIGNNSEYSDAISWKCQTYLKAPIVSYDLTASNINWEAVENCDYYRVYVSGEDFVETTQTSYNLNNLKGGEKIVDVVAYSNNSNYLSSAKSNSLQVTLVHYFKDFTSISFDSETNILTATATEEYQKISVHLATKSYEVKTFNVTKNGDVYTYKLDITTIYQGEEIIGISPCTIDKYNVFNGSVVYIDLQSL